MGSLRKLYTALPPRVCARRKLVDKIKKSAKIVFKDIFKIKQAALEMKIPHENGGNSLTLKTTNIRETILFGK
jgi:hypothetical protein